MAFKKRKLFIRLRFKILNPHQNSKRYNFQKKGCIYKDLKHTLFSGFSRLVNLQSSSLHDLLFYPLSQDFDNIFGIARCSENQIAALEEDLDKSPDKKPAINKLMDRAIPK